jgi:hypothetical protein
VRRLEAVVGGFAALLCACTRTSPQRGLSSTQPPDPARQSARADSASTALSAEDLCVTSGKLGRSGSRLAVESPEFRAVAARQGDNEVELRFTYLGPTEDVARMTSGRVRKQIGLKLRAQDSCNLVYAMWRIAPGPEIALQVKRNPGQRTSAECKNHGYGTIRPHRFGPIADVVPGSSHVLRAVFGESGLTVWADGVVAWEGDLGDEAAGIEGPEGLRSDNARFTFALNAAGGGKGHCPGSSAEQEP